MSIVPVLPSDTLLTKEQFESRQSTEKSRNQSVLQPVEVLALVKEFQSSTSRQREIVLTIHRSKGWKALDYRTFELFAKRELKITKGRLYDILNGALIDEQLKKVRTVRTFLGSVPDRLVRVLIKIRNPKGSNVLTEQHIGDLRQEAYTQAQQVAQDTTYKSFDGKPNPHNGRITIPILERIVREIMQREGVYAPNQIVSSDQEEEISPIMVRPAKPAAMQVVGNKLRVHAALEDGTTVRLELSVGQIKQVLGYPLK